MISHSGANGIPTARHLEYRNPSAALSKKREMKNYHIKFSYNGEGELEPQVRRYEATSPGHAFEKCLQEFPGAKLLECRHEGRIVGITHGCITYAPPSTVRIVAEPAPKVEETKFPFYDDCLGTRRSLSG